MIKGLSIAVLLMVVGISGVAMLKADPEKAAGTGRLFEMRTYTAAEGKLDELHARFRDHTNSLFVKHGMTLIGYWVPTDPVKSKNTLIYILAYPDKEARDKSWKGFMGDPDWKKAQSESERNGKLVAKVVSEFMTPTDYSPMK